jgi:hypothetical protein
MTTDYKTKYRRLRKRHHELRTALQYWLRGEFHFLFMKDVNTYPHGRKDYDDAILRIMRKGSTGQRLLEALGDDWEEVLANGESSCQSH